MRKTFKNFLSLLLTLSMAFSMVGYVPVMAEGGIVDDMVIPAGSSDSQDDLEGKVIPVEVETSDDTTGSSEENDSYEGEPMLTSLEEETEGNPDEENTLPYTPFSNEPSHKPSQQQLQTTPSFSSQTRLKM